MNLSGRSVGQAVRFYKLEPGRPAGRLRRPEPPAGQAADPRRAAPTAARRGSATSPPTSAPTTTPGSGSASASAGAIDAADFVLSRFRTAERPVIDDALILASQAVAVWVDPGARRRHEPIQWTRRDGQCQLIDDQPAAIDEPIARRSTATDTDLIDLRGGPPLPVNTYEGMFLLDSTKVAVAWDDRSSTSTTS